MADAATSILDRCGNRRLVVVTGKGGVGKTIVSVVLARLLAARGKRALLIEVDPRENAHQMLGLAPTGGEQVAAGPNLALQSLKPRDVLDRLVREQVKVEILSKRVLRSPVYQHFAEGAPGLKELAVLGHARDAALQHRVDVVVLDAPATGHGLALLRAPLVVSQVIEAGPFGRLARDIATFSGDPRQCGVLVVTTAEEMPVQEALELVAALDGELGRAPEGIVANALYPPLEEADRELAERDPAIALWRDRRRVAERELTRLETSVEGPIVRLPLLATHRGPQLVAALAAAWSGGEGGS